MTPVSSVYFDSSPLLRVLLGQGHHEAIADLMRTASDFHLSRLTLVESNRTLLRLGVEARATEVDLADAQRALRAIVTRSIVWEISREVCDLACRVSPTVPLRSLDAIHLATWQLVRRLDSELRLVTTDRRLAAAAGVDPIDT